MNTNRLLTIVLALLATGALVLGWFVGISPKLAEAQQAEQDRAAVDAQNVAHEAVLADLAEQYEHIDELRAELAALEEYIPGDQDLEDFLDALATIAAGTEVTLANVTMGEGMPVSAAVEGEAAQPTGPTEGALYAIPVTVHVDGALPNTLAFLQAAQTLSRVFVVTNVLTTQSAADLVGTIYVIPSGAADPVPAP